MGKRKVIVTIPPHAPYVEEVLAHEVVSGIRLNTVMPVKGSLEGKLKELNDKAKEKGKDLWIDLKSRQLRVTELGSPPFTDIKLSHEIEVFTPTKAYFNGRDESATILEVDGNRLIMQEGPRRVVGPGESVTIPHPTLQVRGFLTDTDKKYIEAANAIGLHTYMLSFVESQADVECLLNYDPNAIVRAKIESVKGLSYVSNSYEGDFRLIAARGDLYMELRWPHEVPLALEDILKKDSEAIAASRILSSLENSPEPSCSDIGDVDSMLRMGYKTFMLGDEICQKRESTIAALNVMYCMTRRYNDGTINN